MKFFIVLALVALASAVPSYNNRGAYGSSGSYGSSYGASSGSRYGSGSSFGLTGLSGSSGYSSGLSLGNSYSAAAPLSGQLILAQVVGTAAQAAPASNFGYSGYSQNQYAQRSSSYNQGPITAAVHSTRNVEVVDVPSSGTPAQPQSIVIGPSVNPLDFEFQSQSSPVTVRQTHIPGQPNEPQYSKHEEEPDYLKQEIVKPIVHEVTEAIQPYRKISQEVRPVQETISQLITRGQQQQTQQYNRQSLRQSSYAAAAPVQTVQAVALQPVQAQVVAQPATQYVLQPVQQAQSAQFALVQAAPALSTGYSSGYSSGFSAQPSLALTGSTSYASKPSSSFSSFSSEVSGADAYRK